MMTLLKQIMWIPLSRLYGCYIHFPLSELQANDSNNMSPRRLYTAARKCPDAQTQACQSKFGRPAVVLRPQPTVKGLKDWIQKSAAAPPPPSAD